MRETTWFGESKSRIESLAATIMGPQSPHVDVSFERLRPMNFRVYCNSIPYLKYLERNFAPVAIEPGRPSATLYMERSGRRDVLSEAGYDCGPVETPCIALFDEESYTCLIVGTDEYGLLKSTIIGMHSRLLLADDYFPLHAAAVRFGKAGVVLIGHHGAGKSTALLNLIRAGRDRMDIKVLTDDWAVARRVDSDIVIHSVERQMSFSERLVQENHELVLEDAFRRNSVEGIDKAWVEIEEIFGCGAYIASTRLDRVTVFSPNNGPVLIKSIESDELAALLVDSAYHMPDCGNGIVARMHAFWKDALHGIDCVEIDSRYSSKSKGEVYEEILQRIAAPERTNLPEP